MQRKMVVSPWISQAVGSFGLPRGTLLDLFGHVHQDIPRVYDSIKYIRMTDARLFLHRFVTTDRSGAGHLFLFGIDDTTSPDHLTLIQINHRLV